MNDAASNESQVDPDGAAPATPDADEAPKAPAKRRARKSAAEASADVAGEDAEGLTDKPAPKPRRRKAAVADAAEPGAEAAVPAGPPGAAQVAEPMVAPAGEPAAPQPLFTLGPDAEAEAAGNGVASATEESRGDPAPQGGGDAPRRERRRRDRPGRAPREGDAHAGGAAGAAGADSGASEGEGGEGAEPAAEPLPPLERVDVTERFADVLSGQYDAESPEGEEAPATGKRVLRPEPEAPKLHKVLAQAGIGSRRDMEELIQEGRVTVNGEQAHLGMRITHGDQIKVAGKPVKVRIAPPPARVLAYHKPVGEVVTHHDPEGRPTVFRRLPRLPQGKWLSVGRLDINTEGLLLFTTSGELSNQLMHPRFGVEREYAVRVLGMLSEDDRAELLEGVEIDGQTASFKSIEDGGGEGANHWYRVVIAEGRNREVRRLFEEEGLTVSRLIRIRYGAVVLPRGLKRGTWVELGEEDVRAIRRSTGFEPRQGQGQGPQQGHGQGYGPGQGQGKKNRKKRRGPKDGNGPMPPQAGPRQEGRDPRGAPPPPQRQGDHDNDYDDDIPLRIPNPLEQTFDRRFATGSKRISAGFGRPSDQDPSRPSGGQGQGKGPKQPDPMQTSVGYIGADAYFRKAGGGGKGRNRRGR